MSTCLWASTQFKAPFPLLWTITNSKSLGAGGLPIFLLDYSSIISWWFSSGFGHFIHFGSTGIGSRPMVFKPRQFIVEEADESVFDEKDKEMKSPQHWGWLFTHPNNDTFTPSEHANQKYEREKW